MPERIMLTVLIDLDPTPGSFHTAENAAMNVQAILLNTVGHYNPVVLTNNPENKE